MHNPLTGRRTGTGWTVPAALLTAVLLVLTVAGCSAPAAPDQAASSAAPAADAFPRTVQVDGAEITLQQRPEAIIVLSPSLTETVFGVGAGEQVKAVDSLSTYPAEAPTSDLSAFQPNAEAIAAMEPDLVLLSDDQNGIVAALGALSIPTVQLSSVADLDQAYAQMITIGELTGHEAQGRQLAADVRTQVDDAAASVASAGPLTYYFELGPELYSSTSDTFTGSVLTKFQLSSIADAAPEAASSGGYPQLNAEFIIDADPDLIFLTGGSDPAAVRARAGWDVIRAVKDTDGIVALDDDVASRWGPRLGQLAEQVATAVRQVQ